VIPPFSHRQHLYISKNAFQESVSALARHWL
jgi:hypothetical protein